jgi:restriction endonuclease S subunit
LAQSKLWDRDTLCITIAANIADTAILKFPACFPDSIIGFISDPEQSDVRFVKYCMETLKVHFESISRGTTQDNLSVEKLLSIKFKAPQVAEQKKIAAILTAYDDLIEVNQRRIAALETMAEELYREWFVRLCFPGHAKVKLVKGVPEAWDVLPFTKVANINPTERLPKGEEVPYVGMDELSTSSMYFVSHEKRKDGSGSKFRNRDVLVPRITPCLENGKRGFTMTLAEGELAVGSTEFIVVREKLFSAEHLYLLTCSNTFRQHAELSMTGASGRQRV